MTQIGMDIDALERMADRYFSGSEIQEAVQRRTRASYRRAVDSLNKQRERKEERDAGNLKVGGKLLPEQLAPKEGIIRDGDEIEKLLVGHKSPQLFSEINLVDLSQSVPVLTPEEVDYLDSVAAAARDALLPDGRKVNWGNGYGNGNESIAELYMALELNGYNDIPVPVTLEEAQELLKEKDENGKPRWFMMSRYLDTNTNTPGVTPDAMVIEYISGERYPIGAGGSAGGRGDNFSGGSGISGYGNSGIVALVSANSRIANRQFLDNIAQTVTKLTQKMASARHIEMDGVTFDSSVDKLLDTELMDLADTLKTSININSWWGARPGTPVAQEGQAIVSTLVEHWVQLELSKHVNPDTEAEIDWNNRLTSMQKGMTTMDGAQIALFAGYDGYFSNHPSWMRDTSEHSDWSNNEDVNLSRQQVIWLNRTGLVVVNRPMTNQESKNLMDN
jgi:hypothetical protein